MHQTIYRVDSFHIRCNSISCPPWGASTKHVHQVVYLRQPVLFLSTREEWNFSLWSSSKVELLHPEWGMITVLVRVVKASRMIVILTVSHEDRFHSTPAETPTSKHRQWENRHANLQLCQLSCAVRITKQKYQQPGLVIAQCLGMRPQKIQHKNKQGLTQNTQIPTGNTLLHKWNWGSSIEASHIHIKFHLGRIFPGRDY